MNYTLKYKSPIGLLLIESDGEYITTIRMVEDEHSLEVPNDDEIAAKLPLFEETRRWLDIYFCGQEPTFTPPLAPIGGEFRQSVWKLLSLIPYGELTTYGEIAKQIAKQEGKLKMSAQAVGGAIGSNPISIIIPCHRVVGANGSLTGYAGGIDTKVKLLTLESIDMSRLHLPHKK